LEKRHNSIKLKLTSDYAAHSKVLRADSRACIPGVINRTKPTISNSQNPACARVDACVYLHKAEGSPSGALISSTRSALGERQRSR
jgi:hypothetical protein